MQLREYTAAGGVVLDESDRVLLLERWIQREAGLIHEVRLPKGHVDPGETDDEAARREVCEESGYCQVRIVADLGTAQSEWTNPLERVRRVEHYYLMRLVSPERAAPDFHSADEALFRVLWAGDLTDAQQRLTYASEKDFAGRALAALTARPARDAGAT